MTRCIVCGYQIPIGRGGLLCSDRCSDQLEKNRGELRARLQRKVNKSTEKYKPLHETISIVTAISARILLDLDVPVYTSNLDLDSELCKRSDWFKKLSVEYRHRCIAMSISNVGYTKYASSGRGKKTYRVADDPKELKTKLMLIAGVNS
jgi:hypothetical protein